MERKKQIVLRRIVLFLLLLLPNIYATFRVNDLTLSPVKTLAYIVVVAVCLLFPAILLRSKTYFVAEGIMSVFCAPIEIASIFLNHETASKTFLSLIYFTNRQEAFELVSSLWFLFILLIVIWVIYFLLAAKENQEWLLPKSIRITLLAFIPVLLISGLTVFCVIDKRMNPATTTAHTLEKAANKLRLKFYKIFPYNFYINSAEVIKEEFTARQQLKAVESFSFGIDAKQDTMPEIVVLVIGETARSCNFSVNGYSRPTTPRLSRRGNLVSFTRAYSQANVTAIAVPHIISRIDVQDNKLLYNEKNLVDAFHEAGFSNAWISSQTVGTYTARMLKTTDYHYQSGKGLSSVDNYDIRLVDEVNKAVDQLGCAKQMLVLHTMGSHWRYDSRYPEEFNVFRPSFDKHFNLAKFSENIKEQLVNSYDNSILYTDYFLDSLITSIDILDIPAVLLYLSDHGENLYDDNRHLVLHSSSGGTRYEYNIPFIIWYSDEYAVQYPDKIEALQNNKNQQFNSSVVFHTLLDAVGVEQGISRSKSLCSPQFCSMDTMFALTSNEKMIKILADTIIH